MESHIAGIAETAKLAAAACEYATWALGLARTKYGDAFDGWPQEVQHAVVLTLTTQGLLTPEAVAAPALNLDYAVYGMGLGIGTQTASVPDARVQQMLSRLMDGFATGRAEAIKAVMAFPTEGGAQ